ncbi:MAG: single-stranded-DNA-specific exonuclease RecJ, partial [Rhodanobacteraceae bacterium]
LEDALQPVLQSDGELAPADLELELARQLRLAGPWGQGFAAPLFDNLFECAAQKSVGADGAHRRLRLRDPRDGRLHGAVWFHAGGDIPQGVPLRVAFELMIDEWQGRESLRLLLRHWETA